KRSVGGAATSEATTEGATEATTEERTAAPPLDWAAVDAVLLDMDGTLLDLHYDNAIWNQELPLRLTQRDLNVQEPTAAQVEATNAELVQRMARVRGKLQFYDLSYWAELTGFDLLALHHDCAHKIRYRPGALAFLEALQTSDKRVVLATNAHRDCLEIKHQHTGILDYFDAVVSSHDYRAPKEEQAFWYALEDQQALQRERCLFIDDNLEVLRSAARFGVRHLRCVSHPDLNKEPRDTAEFVAVDDLSSLLPIDVGA
ncbi:MAG: HAD-IA family hydrolase, partial [Pseudomonadota bacterium]